MDKFKSKRKNRPEAKIQESIINKLRSMEWLVKPTHGNAFQSGFPDLYAAHAKYGARWIECKVEGKYKFTPAQKLWFPQFSAAGVGIWILVSSEQSEIDKLFRAANWYQYLKGF